MLGRIGIDFQMLDSGCCGMAGSFGFEKGEKYDVSRQSASADCSPQAETSESTLVVADGFSCRDQIQQLAGRDAVHIAQVAQRALRESGRTGPEKTQVKPRPTRAGKVVMAAGAGAAIALAGLVVTRR